MSADLLFHVLLTMAIVVIAGRALGLVARHVGQPPGIGEVLLGIMLGAVAVSVWSRHPRKRTCFRNR